MMSVIQHLDSNNLFDIMADLAYERNEQLWVVGGYVRDFLLERPNKDIDLTIVGDLDGYIKDLIEILNIDEKDVSTFAGYGTVHFMYKGYDLEFVRARKESYIEESRKPKVEVGTLEEDISRRDFTINTIAISLNRTTYGEIVNLHDGQNDLIDGIIKTPLSPMETFEDDPLRIFRMVRFATRFNFQIDPNTFEGAKNSIHRLSIVSKERLAIEFVKIMGGEDPCRGLQLLLDLGAMEFYIPELSILAGQEQRGDYHHKDVWGHTLDVVGKVVKASKELDMGDTTWLRIAALFHDVGKSKAKAFKEGVGWTFHAHEEVGANMIPGIFSRLKFPEYRSKYVETLARLHGRFRGIEKDEVKDSAIRRIINDADPFFEDLIQVYLFDYSTHNNRNIERIEFVNKKVLERIEKFRNNESKRFERTVSLLTGKEIMEFLDIPPGPVVGKIKNLVSNEMDEGRLLTKEDAYRFIKTVEI